MKLAQVEGGVVVNVIEVDGAAIPAFAQGWPQVDVAGPGWLYDGTDFSPPVIVPDLDAERAAMTCSPAQMHIALHRAGQLANVQAIVNADPEAAIIWAKATEISRASPLIMALATPEFTPEIIDDLFRAAMQIKI